MTALHRLLSAIAKESALQTFPVMLFLALRVVDEGDDFMTASATSSMT